MGTLYPLGILYPAIHEHPRNFSQEFIDATVGGGGTLPCIFNRRGARRSNHAEDSLLRNAMETLSRDERAVLIRTIAGFSSEEIADSYHLSAEAVETQIERARRRVRHVLRISR